METGDLRNDLLQIADQFILHFSQPSARRLIAVILSTFSTEDGVKDSWWSTQGQPKIEKLREVFERVKLRGQLSQISDVDTLILLFSSLLMHRCLFGDAGYLWRGEIATRAAIDFLISR